MKLNKLRSALSHFSKNNARLSFNKVLNTLKVTHSTSLVTDCETYIVLNSNYNLSEGLYPIKQLGEFSSKVELDYDSFPEFPLFEGHESSNASIIDLLSLSKHASNDETRVYLNTVYFDTNTIVSTNGFHLKYVPTDYNLKDTYLVPKDSVSILAKLIKDFKLPDTITLQWSREFVKFECNEFTLFARLIQHEYLKYKSVISIKTSNTITISKLPDIKTLKEFINPRSQLIVLEGLDNEVFYKVRDTDIKIKIGSCESNFEVGFNAKYLALCAENKIDFKIDFNNELSPFIIDSNTILMPMKF
jgi:DNA polymerase III sliding clamp (beta) subunit (PCNA family)